LLTGDDIYPLFWDFTSPGDEVAQALVGLACRISASGRGLNADF